MANLNEIAHARARELTYRAGQPGGSSDSNLAVFRDVLLTFNEIIKHYQSGRRVFPLPHAKLSRAQASTLRMLHTRSYPSLYTQSQFVESLDPACPDCGTACTLDHMLWQCPSLQGPQRTTEEEWSSMLRSSDLPHQLRAVHRARDAAVRLGLPYGA